MNREEYMKQLAYLLQDVPDMEREEALQYYRDYFDDAGESEESNVIATLGSPERVAAMIKDGLNGEDESAGEYTDSGYTDERFREDNKVPEPRAGSYNESQTGSREENRQRGQNHYYQGQYQQGQYRQERESYRQEWQREKKGPNRGLGTIILIGILCIIALPVILPIVGAVFGIIFGLLGAIFGVVMAALAGTFGFGVTGVTLIGVGIAKVFIAPATGLLFIGSGMIVLAICILLIAVCIILIGKFVPWIIRTLTSLLSRILSRGRSRR